MYHCHSLGCYHKGPLTAWLINNRNALLKALETGSPDQGADKAGWGPLLGGRLLVVPSLGRGGRELSGVCYKGTHPIHGGSTLAASSPPKGPACLCHTQTFRPHFAYPFAHQWTVGLHCLSVHLLFSFIFFSRSILMLTHFRANCRH